MGTPLCAVPRPSTAAPLGLERERGRGEGVHACPAHAAPRLRRLELGQQPTRACAGQACEARSARTKEPRARVRRASRDARADPECACARLRARVPTSPRRATLREGPERACAERPGTRARSSERALQDAGGARRSERAPGARAQSASGRAHRPGARVREPARPAGARASSLPLPSRTATQWRRPFPRRGPSPTYSLTWTASFWVRSLRPPPAKTVQGKVREGRRLPGPAPRGGRRAWRRRGPDASRDSHFRRPRVGTEYAGAGA